MVKGERISRTLILYAVILHAGCRNLKTFRHFARRYRIMVGAELVILRCVKPLRQNRIIGSAMLSAVVRLREIIM